MRMTRELTVRCGMRCLAISERLLGARVYREEGTDTSEPPLTTGRRTVTSRQIVNFARYSGIRRHTVAAAWFGETFSPLATHQKLPGRQLFDVCLIPVRERLPLLLSVS